MTSPVMGDLIAALRTRLSSVGLLRVELTLPHRLQLAQKILRFKMPTCRVAVEFGGLGVSAIVLHAGRWAGGGSGVAARRNLDCEQYINTPAVVKIFKVFSWWCTWRSSSRSFPGLSSTAVCGTDQQDVLPGQGSTSFAERSLPDRVHLRFEEQNLETFRYSSSPASQRVMGGAVHCRERGCKKYFTLSS